MLEKSYVELSDMEVEKVVGGAASADKTEAYRSNARTLLTSNRDNYPFKSKLTKDYGGYVITFKYVNFNGFSYSYEYEVIENGVVVFTESEADFIM